MSLRALPHLVCRRSVSRSHQGTHKRPAMGLQVQGLASPPSASCFRFAGLLARVSVLAAYAQYPEPGSRRQQKSNRPPARGRIGTLHNGGEMALESGLMLRHCLRWCMHRSLIRIRALMGLRFLCSTPKRGEILAQYHSNKRELIKYGP